MCLKWTVCSEKKVFTREAEFERTKNHNSLPLDFYKVLSMSTFRKL